MSSKIEEGIPCINLPKGGWIFKQLKEDRLIEAAEHKIGTLNEKGQEDFMLDKARCLEPYQVRILSK